MTTRIGLAVLAIAALAGCTTRNEINTPAPAVGQPYDLTGSVVGRVTGNADGLPMGGVTVSALAPGGALSTTSRADGTYELAGLPAGATYDVRFERQGFVPRIAQVNLPSTAGNVGLLHPAATADAVLARGDASLAGVVTYDGLPAAGMHLTVDLRGAGLDLVATATTGADGAYLLTGLPGSPGGWLATLLIAPWDADGDQVPEVTARTAWATLYPGTRTPLDLTFSAPVGPVQGFQITTDLGGGTHAADAPIHLTFSGPIDPDLSRFSLTDQTYSYLNVPVVAQVDPDGVHVTIAPVGGTPLATGHRYGLWVQAVDLTGTTHSQSFSFTASSGGGVEPDVTGLAVVPAHADYNTSSLSLAWTAVPDATSYLVYVRDTLFNPSWVQVGSTGSAPAPALSVYLPPSFDYYSGDNLQTPFAFGTQVDVAVVAVGLTGTNGDLASATPVRVGDTVAPTALSASQRGSASNSSGAPATLWLDVTFGEYMSADGVVIDLPAAGMTATFALDPGLRKGTFTIRVPPSTDGTGSFLVHGATDTSGNPMAPFAGRLTKQTELVVNGGFETGTLSGWTASATGTVAVPVASTMRPATGTTAARLGNASAISQSGTSTLYQDLVVPAGATDVVVRLSYLATASGYGSFDGANCAFTTTSGSSVAGIFYTYGTTSSYVAVGDLHMPSLAGQTVRLICSVSENYNGLSALYLDDVSVIAVQ